MYQSVDKARASQRVQTSQRRRRHTHADTHTAQLSFSILTPFFFSDEVQISHSEFWTANAMLQPPNQIIMGEDTPTKVSRARARTPRIRRARSAAGCSMGSIDRNLPGKVFHVLRFRQQRRVDADTCIAFVLPLHGRAPGHDRLIPSSPNQLQRRVLPPSAASQPKTPIPYAPQHLYLLYKPAFIRLAQHGNTL